MIQAFIDFLKGLLAAPGGEPSSKRFIALFLALLMGVGFISNLYWDYDIDQFILESLMYVLVASMGISGIEKFVPRRDPPKE